MITQGKLVDWAVYVYVILIFTLFHSKADLWKLYTGACACVLCVYIPVHMHMCMNTRRGLRTASDADCLVSLKWGSLIGLELI